MLAVAVDAVVLERIEARVVRRHGHDVWPGPYATSGTPEAWSHGHAYSVRRVRYEATHGPLPTSAPLARTCSEPRCVRPEHARASWAVEQSLARALRCHGLTLRAIGALVGVDHVTVHGWCSTAQEVSPTGDGSWHAQAACRGVPVAAFFEPTHERAAAALCQRCPVADRCLAEGVDTGSVGTWGGKVLAGR